MNLQTLIAYLKYKRKAKTRHGVHSPFVFSFIEDVLRSKTVVSRLQLERILPLDMLSLQGEPLQLLYRILSYYKVQHMMSFIEEGGKVQLYLGNDHIGHELQPTNYAADCMLLDVKDPHAWNALYHMYEHNLNAQSMVIVTNIHKSKLHSAEWEKLHSQKDVRLSIDVFHIGLLFFKEDFKEQQHFVVK